MKKYAVIYSREDYGDTKVFDFIGDAINAADSEYSHLTRKERKNSTIEVAELTEEDLSEDAFEDGEIDWTFWKQYSPFKFGARDREAGNLIETFTTREEAYEAIMEYEKTDITEETYNEDFYEICVDYGDGWETYVEHEKYKAQNKYDKSNTKKYGLKLNTSTDSDIIEWLEAQDSKQGAIKAAIREMMNK